MALNRDQLLEMWRNEERNLSTQLAARQADITKYDELLAGMDSGAYEGIDGRVVEQRREQFNNEREVARADVVTLQITIKNVLGRIEGASSPKASGQ